MPSELPVTVDGAVTAATPATRPWCPNAMVRPAVPVALVVTRPLVLPDAVATAATVAPPVSLLRRAVPVELVGPVESEVPAGSRPPVRPVAAVMAVSEVWAATARPPTEAPVGPVVPEDSAETQPLVLPVPVEPVATVASVVSGRQPVRRVLAAAVEPAVWEQLAPVAPVVLEGPEVQVAPVVQVGPVAPVE